MADNLSVTPGSGAVVAAEDLGGALVQRVKPVLGNIDVDGGDISDSNPMPIKATTLPLPTGAATESTLDAINTALGSPMQQTGGSVSVTNFPATQPVSGTVAVSNLPATQTISGSVSVSNLPATQAVSGTVTANIGTTNGLALDSTLSAIETALGSPMQQTGGSVSVSNFPATQTVSGSVSVSNLPLTQPVSGSVSVTNFSDLSSIAVSNFPATQPISGSVTANAGTNLNTSALALESGGHLESIDSKLTSPLTVTWSILNTNQTFIIPSSTVLNSNINSQSIDVSGVIGFCVQLIWTGVPTGSFKLQGSCDASSPSNWTDVSSSSFSVSAAGSLIYNVSDCFYSFMRVVYTDSSGGASTAILTVSTFNGKAKI